MEMNSWDSMMPGFSGGVPSSAPQANTDMISRLVDTISKPIPDSMIRAATLPIAGAHAATVPTSLQTPIGDYQPHQLDERRVTGRNAATRQGIANTFTAAGNALGAIVSKEAQIKQGHIKDAAVRVLTAQQAIDEAKVAHDQAIAAGDAEAASKYQEIIQTNQQARDGVFADPKMRKSLQKGFDISYTDPQSNKTEEHAAVQAALKEAKTMQEKRDAMKKLMAQRNQASGQAMGAAFEKAMPTGMAANTLAQQQLAQQLAQQKINQAALKDLLTFRASIYRSDKTYDAAQQRIVAQGIMQQARFAQQDYQMGQRFAQAQKMLGQRFAQENHLVYLRATVARNLANEIYTDKEFDPLTMKTKSEKTAQSYNNNYLADISGIDKIIKQRDAAFPGGATSSKAKNDPQTYEAYNAQIRLLESMRDSDKQKADHYNTLAGNISKAFNVTGVGNDGSGSFNGTNQSDSVGGDAGFDDPLAWLNGGEESSSSEE